MSDDNALTQVHPEGEPQKHLSELLARQRNPDRPAKKKPPTPEPAPKPATMSNKDFRRHLKQIVARRRDEDQPPVGKKPPKLEPSKLTAVSEKKPPAAETAKFKVRRKAK